MGAQDADAFALDLNLAAAEEAARQISLRCIGGLVAVDFVGMKQGKHQRAVAEAFRKSLAGWLGRASEVLDLSPARRVRGGDRAAGAAGARCVGRACL